MFCHFNDYRLTFQVISDEDEESSVISFSAGTILGETSLIYPTISKANIKCATICELHTLSLSDLGRALYIYPGGFPNMWTVVEDRMEFAKDLILLKEARCMEEDDTDYISLEDNSIFWIKSRWKQLYEIKVSILKVGKLRYLNTF